MALGNALVKARWRMQAFAVAERENTRAPDAFVRDLESWTCWACPYGPGMSGDKRWGANRSVVQSSQGGSVTEGCRREAPRCGSCTEDDGFVAGGRSCF